MSNQPAPLKIRRLSTGYYHIVGPDGSWAQPPSWPCPDEQVLASSIFGAASWAFRMALTRANEEALR
jgi:hypothetical protein